MYKNLTKNKDLEEKIFEMFGGKENMEEHTFNFKITKEFNFDFENGDFDFCYGTFEIKTFFGGMKEYMFVIANGNYNNVSYLEDEFSFPAFLIKDSNEKFIQKTLNKLEEAGNKIIPQNIQEINEAKKILEENSNKLKYINYEGANFYSFKNGFNGKSNVGIHYGENPEIDVYFKETGETKSFSPNEIISYYSK